MWAHMIWTKIKEWFNKPSLEEQFIESIQEDPTPKPKKTRKAKTEQVSK